MNLYNGRINLEEEIKKEKRENSKIIIARAKESSKVAYWIRNFKGKNYLFKKTAYEEKYRSLLVGKIAQEVGISFPKTKLAFYKGSDGELIEDYRKEGYAYISGTEILMEYFYFLEANNKIDILFKDYNPYYYDEELILRKMNNLETIWNAVEFHFRKYPNKNTIVYQIISSLANRFALDFLTMQQDRTDFNWEIEENPLKDEGHLTPLFDCDKSFQSSFLIKLDSGENQKTSDTYEKLAYYLEISHSNYTSFFYSLFETYTPDRINAMIKELEKENDFIMEKEIKTEIMESYQIHYQEMQKILDNLNMKNRR